MRTHRARFASWMAGIGLLALIPASVAGQAAAAGAVADSIAHPIVEPCGTRIDPPGHLRSVAGDSALSAQEAEALGRLERALRAANAPLGELWHNGAPDQAARGAILTTIRANYHDWWRSVVELLGHERAAELMDRDPEPVARDDGGRAGARRCLATSIRRLLGLE